MLLLLLSMVAVAVLELVVGLVEQPFAKACSLFCCLAGNSISEGKGREKEGKGERLS